MLKLNEQDTIEYMLSQATYFDKRKQKRHWCCATGHDGAGNLTCGSTSDQMRPQSRMRWIQKQLDYKFL